MAFGKFMKEQLFPEDPMDWFILLLILTVVGGALVMVVLMFSSGVL